MTVLQMKIAEISKLRPEKFSNGLRGKKIISKMCLLDENFNLEVIDRYDTPSRSEFSAGERQILSLSFITAMSRISDGKAPLVMDTPFGRLSSQHRNNITEHLPDLSEQLVLFVTDEELRGQARQNLEARIGAEYRLHFDHDTSCTKIVEVSG